MALSQPTYFPTSQTPFHKPQFIGTSQNPRRLIFPTTETPRYPLISLFHTARSKPCSFLRTISCVAFDGDISDDGTRDSTSLSTSISSVFVKGLPDSVSEGRLRKVFSEFGEVSNVTSNSVRAYIAFDPDHSMISKAPLIFHHLSWLRTTTCGIKTVVKIIINEKTQQSLGYGYVWFSKKEDAQLAVEAMNGKFFDGRFILVKFGQPGLSRRRRSHSDSLFVNK